MAAPVRPTFVQVGPYKYRVEYHPGRIADIDEVVLGVCKHDEQVIVVNSDLAPDQLASTLLHEVLHALFTSSGTDEHLKNEEKVCKSLEGPLLQLLRDNPTLVAFLAEGAEPKRRTR